MVDIPNPYCFKSKKKKKEKHEVTQANRKVVNMAYPACQQQCQSWPARRDATTSGGGALCGGVLGVRRGAGAPAVRPSPSWSQGSCGLQAH